MILVRRTRTANPTAVKRQLMCAAQRGTHNSYSWYLLAGGRTTDRCITFASRFTTTSTGNDQRVYTDPTAHVEQLISIVGKQNLILDDDEKQKYIHDWTHSYRGGSVVCLPDSTTMISDVLKYCNTNGIAVVPQGGNTGLVGGSVGTNHELILSLQRMTKIHSIDDQAATVTCEAGCILEVLNTAVEEKGFTVPLDLGAKGSCMIGGNVSTNAGGMRLIKFGSLHKNVLGLEVVLADGTVLDMLRALHKDNMGYSIKDLFIGAEGTLGVVTQVCLALPPKPRSRAVLLFKIRSFADVACLLKTARQGVGDALTAFEFLDRNCMKALCRLDVELTERLPASFTAQPVYDDFLTSTSSCGSDAASPAAGIDGAVFVLIECTDSGNSSTAAYLFREKIESFSADLLQTEYVVDAVLSQHKSHERMLWRIREQCPVTLMELSRLTLTKHPICGLETDCSRMQPPVVAADINVVRKLFKFDVSVALRHTSEVVANLKQKLLEEGCMVHGMTLPEATEEGSGRKVKVGAFHDCDLEFFNFGHAGDQNLHLNVMGTVKISGSNIEEEIERGRHLLTQIYEVLCKHVYALVLERKGSLSAEHGIGQQKAAVLSLGRSAAEMQLMYGMKKLMDPNNIMNPGKVLPLR